MNWCSELKIGSLSLGICLFLTGTLGACATHAPQGEVTPAVRNADPIEGTWRVGLSRTEIIIEPCEGGPEDELCGRLVAYEGEADQRDYANPDWLAWGQRLCGAVIVTQLKRKEDENLYAGYLYAPESGDTLYLELSMFMPSRISAKSFYGADLEEAVDLGISALLGGAPSAYDILWLLTRATIGEEALGETQEWARVESAGRSCDPSTERPGALR
jgi:hypothetical protein